MVDICGIKIHREMDKGTFDSLLNFVSSEKRDRINRFKFFDDAQRCLLGDLLARFALCNKLSVKNNQLRFGSNEYEKPILIQPKGLHFNISHSGDWVVCAVDNQPVGIDVEVIKLIDFDIAKRFFTEDEYSDLINKNENERLKYFYTLWTLKESYIKAAGKGLSLPLNSFSFRIKNGNIQLTSENEFGPCSFWKHGIDKNHIIAVCALNDKFNDIELINIPLLLTSRVI